MPEKCQLTIFYDGSCGVCHAEISHYRSIAGQRIQFVNIADPDFDASVFGKSLESFQSQMHALDAEGHFFTGVDAFCQLWDLLPSPFYPRLSTFVRVPGINCMARAGYTVFAKFRHLLPSSQVQSCSISNKHR